VTASSKVFSSWYDNEWGFSHRMVDLALIDREEAESP
jgi:glyceraldehyde-3-phosphate dehydrogenase/erythrose-4-phosphate dehydrogenase